MTRLGWRRERERNPRSAAAAGLALRQCVRTSFDQQTNSAQVVPAATNLRWGVALDSSRPHCGSMSGKDACGLWCRRMLEQWGERWRDRQRSVSIDAIGFAIAV